MQIEDLVSLQKPTNKGRVGGHVHVYSIGGDECVGYMYANPMIKGRPAAPCLALC
jgi:hypothetical protein